MKTRLLAVVAVLLLLAAACGGSDDGGSSAETGGSSESSGDSGSSSESEAPATTEKPEEEVIEIKSIDEDQGQSLAGQTVTAPPLGDRGPAPSGTLDYVWHSNFSPKWFDPSINTATVSQYATQYLMHDAVIKGIPGQTFAPSLAESYTVADDFMSAEITLREGLTFHDGSPLTTEDVKFSYENYNGANAKPLKDNLDNIELISDTVIRFNFTQPFLDFIVLYGSTASGAGWVLPSDYYQEVGAEGFIEAPIGAGPFKFVENRENVKIVYEAFDDYWKKNPGVANLNFNVITDSATRLSALKTGEVDMINRVPGDLLDAARNDDNITLAPSANLPFWMEFIGYAEPDSPFNDKRVREAATIALNRVAINEAEAGGFGGDVGNWIPESWPGAIAAEPIEQDLERARQLMAEAGYADGFEVSQLTPLPPYITLGERVVTMLGEIGIRTTLNKMDRGAFLADVNSGKDGTLDGLLVNISGAGGGASARIAVFATCDGTGSRICEEFVDERYDRYLASTDADERKKILDEIQQYLVDEFIFPYVYTLGFTNAQGPNVVNAPGDVWGSIPQYVYAGPWEDIQVSG